MADSMLPQRWSRVTGPVGTFNSLDEPGAGEKPSTLKTALELLALVRRHWLLVGIVGVCCAGVVVYRLKRQLPTYESIAVIRLEDKRRELSGTLRTAPNSPGLRPFADPVLSQIQVLKSKAVAREVVEKEGLQLRTVDRGLPPTWMDSVRVSAAAKHDTISLRLTESGTTARAGNTEITAPYGQPLEIAGVRFIVPQKPPFASSRLVVIPLESATNEIVGGLKAQARERTDVIDVSYDAPDPLLAQRIVNSVVESFQTVNARTAKQESVLRREFIEQQLHKVELLMIEAQAAYNRFRSRERVYSSQDKLKSQQADMSNIEIRRQELNADRQMYTALMDSLQLPHAGHPSAERLSALASSPGVASNPVVSQLFGQLFQLRAARDSLTGGQWGRSPENPDIKHLDALIASTESRVIEAVRAQVGSIQARIAALDQLRNNVGERLATLPQTESEETTLQAQAQTYQREADRLREELQSAQIAEAAEVGQVEIVDLASMPGTPIGSGRRPKAILALLIGLSLGIVTAYVRENYRPVIRRRDDLEQSIALPNLALVPQIRSTNGNVQRTLGRVLMLPRFSRNGNGNGHGRLEERPAELVTVSDIRSSGAEAYRTLRTNLLFSAAVRGLRRIVVTSPGPTEGKSTTAANLAIAFAQQGQSVLLVDCDLRRSRIHKMFDQQQTPGLTNVLVGVAESLDEAIRPTKVPGLLILPSGSPPPNPAELLGSSAMQQLMDVLVKRFDVVILDTPPVIAASDAAILSRVVDGTLIVVRAGRTERGALQNAVQQLSTVGARILGTVLNDPDGEVPRYSPYYSYYYDNYYDYSANTQS